MPTPGGPSSSDRLAVGDEAAGRELADLACGSSEGWAAKSKPRARARTGSARASAAISMRRWSLRAISRSHRRASASRSVSSRRAASSSRLSSWSRIAVSLQPRQHAPTSGSSRSSIVTSAPPTAARTRRAGAAVRLGFRHRSQVPGRLAQPAAGSQRTPSKWARSTTR